MPPMTALTQAERGELVRRLRHMAKLCQYGGLNDILNDAAAALSALESDPVRCPGCDEWRLRAFAAEIEVKRLQAALRVNALREGYTHAEVDAIIADK